MHTHWLHSHLQEHTQKRVNLLYAWNHLNLIHTMFKTRINSPKYPTLAGEIFQLLIKHRGPLYFRQKLCMWHETADCDNEILDWLSLGGIDVC